MPAIKMQPKQDEFLSASQDIVIGGGSAGGGKSYALECEPMRHVGVNGFVSVMLRRTFSEVKKPGGLWDEAMQLYPQFGGIPKQQAGVFRFPNNVQFAFGHIQRDADLEAWKSSQIALLMMDQLETFTERMFFYMGSRNRSKCGIMSYQRHTANPDPGWLADFLDFWIASDGYADLDKAGKERCFIRLGHEIHWADTKEELIDKFQASNKPEDKIDPKSVTFIPFTVYDNPILLEADPGYLASLKALGFVDRERLLGHPKRGGNWHIKAGAGKIFNQTWYPTTSRENLPNDHLTILCRFFDTAATAKETKKDDPDYTAGVLVRMRGHRCWVEHSIARQIGPGAVNRFMKDTFIQDSVDAKAQGIRYMARWEREPGSASIREAHRLVNELQGIDAVAIPKRKSKMADWKAFAAQSLNGNVELLEAGWNRGWLAHMHGQPDLPHDDIADATAGAYNELVKELPRNKKKAKSRQG